MSFDEQLYAALVDGYDISELGRMLRLGVSKDLESITDAKNLKDAVFEVIKASIRGGWTHTLLSAAKEYNNGNDLIKALPLVPPIETLERYPKNIQENQFMNVRSSGNDSTGRIDLTNGELAKQVIENKFAINALTSQFGRMEKKLDQLSDKFQQAYGMTVVNAAPPATTTQGDYRIIFAAVIVGVFIFAGLYLSGGA